MAGRGPHLIGEPVDLITMDLSYLAITDAIGQVDRQMLAPAVQLIAMVKPTFELHAAALADQPQQVTAAARTAARALGNHGWQILGQQPSPILGAKGAVEILLHAASGLQAADAVPAGPAGGDLRRAVVLAGDETHLNLLPHVRASWTLRGRRPEVLTPGTSRKVTVLGVLEVITGAWVYRPGRRRAADFIALLDQLLAAFPLAPLVAVI